jgi:hypothetical protein
MLSYVITFVPNLVETDELSKYLKRMTERIVISLAFFNFQLQNLG